MEKIVRIRKCAVTSTCTVVEFANKTNTHSEFSYDQDFHMSEFWPNLRESND